MTEIERLTEFVNRPNRARSELEARGWVFKEITVACDPVVEGRYRLHVLVAPAPNRWKSCACTLDADYADSFYYLESLFSDIGEQVAISEKYHEGKT